MQTQRKFLIAVVVVLFTANAMLLWLLPDERDILIAQVTNAVSYGKARGFQCRTYIAPDGTLHRYSIFVPHDIQPDDRLPLILYLNGRGKNGSDGIAPLRDGIGPPIWESKAKFPFVVVWPQCPEGKSWSGNKELAQLALDITALVEDEFGTDPDRVSLSGLSSGGTGVWSLAADYPDRFAAIAPISAGSISSRDIERIAESGLPIWSFHVAQDGEHLVKANRDARRQLIAAGRSPRFSEVHVSDVSGDIYLHDAWSFAYRTSAFLDWLWKQNRKRREFKGTYDSRSLADVVEDSDRHEGFSPDNSSVTLTLPVGGAGTLPTNVIAGVAGEAHLEFRVRDGVERCGIMFAESDADEVTGLTLEVATDAGNTPGGLFHVSNGSQLHAADSVAEQAYVPELWNELRIRWTEQTIHAELNGWSLIDASLTEGLKPESQLRLLAVGEGGSSVEWKDLRTRANQTLPSRPAAGTLMVRPKHPKTSPPVHSMTEIVEAWSRRALRTDNVTLEWTLSQDGISKWSQFRAGAGIPDSADSQLDRLCLGRELARFDSPWNYRRTRVERQGRLVGEVRISDYMRLLNNRFKPNGEQFHPPGAYKSNRTVRQRLDYVVAADSSDKRGIKRLSSTSDTNAIGNLEELYAAAPLMALDPVCRFTNGIDPEKCKPRPGVCWVGETQCVAVDEFIAPESSDRAGQSRRHWLDPARDFLVVRTATYVGRALRSQIDIRYVDQADLGWRPTGWTVIFRSPPAKSALSDRFFPGNDRLFDFAVAEVTDCSVSDPLTPTAADNTFPIGTQFFDNVTGQWFEQLADNQQTPLDQASVSLLASGGNAERSLMEHWRTSVIGFAGVALIAAVLRRRRKILEQRGHHE